jgi:hypothetical protein
MIERSASPAASTVQIPNGTHWIVIMERKKTRLQVRRKNQP